MRVVCECECVYGGGGGVLVCLCVCSGYVCIGVCVWMCVDMFYFGIYETVLAWFNISCMS